MLTKFQVALIVFAMFLVGFIVGESQTSGSTAQVYLQSDFNTISQKTNYFSKSDVYSTIPDNHLCLVPKGNDSIQLGFVQNKTGSMFPNLYGDLDLHVPVPPKEQLQVGMVIVFNKADMNIVHRIVQIGNDGEWYAITRGDNRVFSDEKIRYNQILWRVVGVLY